MTQHNNEFEKWATKHIVSKRLLEFNTMKYENGMYKSHIMQRKFEAWQAAKADNESEIAELRAENKQIDKINASLQAHINILREALEKIVWHDIACYVIAKQALSSTPVQSLQAHDDEVIERCAKACENLITESFSKPLSFNDIANAIRALKGK